MSLEIQKEDRFTVLASEIQNPPENRGDWGTEIVEYRGKYYKLMGVRDDIIVGYPDYSLVATCVSKIEVGCPSIQILDLKESE